MKTRQDKLKELAADNGQPQLEALREDYEWCVEKRDASIFSRQRINYQARNCVWPGQSEDGRKWTPVNGASEVWPWPGASDARVHLVDTFCNEDSATLMTLWRRNKIIATPTESSDLKQGTQVTQMLRWLVYTQMKELADEARLASSLLCERGAFVLSPVWCREQRLGYDEVTLQGLQQLALETEMQMQMGKPPEGWTEDQAWGVLELASSLVDGSQEDRMVNLFRGYWTDVKPEAARKAIRSLRETGAARFTRPYVFKNRPCVWTLAPGEDIFLPEDAPTIEKAAGIHVRELMTEAALRERAVSSDYDPAWVNEVVETQRGNVTNDFRGQVNLRTRRQPGSGNLGRTNTERLYEIIHSYRQLADGEGVLGLHYTCWHPGLTHSKASRKTDFTYAYHGLLNYDHGEYPFQLVQRERRNRVLGDARGYGEIASTWQQLIKSELDQRRDAASLATNPPMRHPIGKPPEQWGPGVKVPGREGEYGFIDGPKYNQGSKEIEETVRAHAMQYFGRPMEDGRNQVGGQAILQELGDVWMNGWGRAYTQVLQLEQQFGPDEIFFRVVGSDKARPMKASREEIQGQFDISVNFNTRLFDPEYVKTLFEFIDRALAWDIGGRVDRDELIAFGFDVVDPNLGERVIKPGQEASAAEVEDERTVLAKMAVGVATDVKPGQAWQLRAQTLEESIQRSPILKKKMAEDETFAEMVMDRMQKLQHQVQQYTVNAETGRQGGKPAMAGGY